MGKRKKNNGAEFRKDVGLVMTVSLFLILLTFFILLNSIAIIDEQKKRLAIGSLIGAFTSMTGGLSVLKTGESIVTAPAPMMKQKEDFERLLAQFDKDSDGRYFQAIIEKNRAILTVGEPALFVPGTHMLNPDSESVLKKLGDFISRGQYPLEIIGHTDNHSAEEKGYRSNRELSCLMALTVQKYLVERGKIGAGRITASGYGSQRAIASNDTPESREKNRRIEMILNFNAPGYVKRLYSEPPAGVFTYKRFNFKVF